MFGTCPLIYDKIIVLHSGCFKILFLKSSSSTYKSLVIFTVTGINPACSAAAGTERTGRRIVISMLALTIFATASAGVSVPADSVLPGMIRAAWQAHGGSDERLVLDSIPLPGREEVTLHLERFYVTTPGTRFVRGQRGQEDEGLAFDPDSVILLRGMKMTGNPARSRFLGHSHVGPIVVLLPMRISRRYFGFTGPGRLRGTSSGASRRRSRGSSCLPSSCSASNVTPRMYKRMPFTRSVIWNSLPAFRSFSGAASRTTSS